MRPLPGAYAETEATESGLGGGFLGFFLGFLLFGAKAEEPESRGRNGIDVMRGGCIGLWNPEGFRASLSEVSETVPLPLHLRPRSHLSGAGCRRYRRTDRCHWCNRRCRDSAPSTGLRLVCGVISFDWLLDQFFFTRCRGNLRRRSCGASTAVSSNESSSSGTSSAPGRPWSIWRSAPAQSAADLEIRRIIGEQLPAALASVVSFVEVLLLDCVRGDSLPNSGESGTIVSDSEEAA